MVIAIPLTRIASRLLMRHLDTVFALCLHPETLNVPLSMLPASGFNFPMATVPVRNGICPAVSNPQSRSEKTAHKPGNSTQAQSLSF